MPIAEVAACTEAERKSSITGAALFSPHVSYGTQQTPRTRARPAGRRACHYPCVNGGGRRDDWRRARPQLMRCSALTTSRSARPPPCCTEVCRPSSTLSSGRTRRLRISRPLALLPAVRSARPTRCACAKESRTVASPSPSTRARESDEPRHAGRPSTPRARRELLEELGAARRATSRAHPPDREGGRAAGRAPSSRRRAASPGGGVAFAHGPFWRCRRVQTRAHV